MRETTPVETAPRIHWRAVLPPALLTLLVLVLFAVAWNRTDMSSWTEPTRYSGDDVHSLALLKAARDGHLVPLTTVRVPQLGAPAEANWNGFLRQHKLQWFAGGLVARVAGLGLTANLMLFANHLLSALSFYAAARMLRARREFALSGAALFAFAPFMFWRGFGHLTVAACWPVPLGLLALGWCTSRRPLHLRSRRFAAAAAIALVIGLHNVYYAALFVQLFALAGLVRVCRLQSWREIVAPLLLVLLVIGAVLVDNVNQPLDRIVEGPGPGALLRPYGNLERFALKPVELLLPAPDAGWAIPRALSIAHWNGTIYKGEMGSAYLGIAGILALGWLVWRGLRNLVRGRRTGAALPLLALAWILLFSVVGGVNSLLGLLGFVWLRGANRFSIVILALALLTAVTALSRLAMRRRAVSLGLLLLALAAALADQIPLNAAPAPSTIARTEASDRTFVTAVETLLPPEGAAAFVLPVIDFPEAPRAFHEQDYEPLRLYLHASRLRLSYGSDKNRPGSEVAPALAALEMPGRIDALRERGFAGVLVVCRALPDGGERILRELALAGHRQIVRSTDGHFLFVPFSVPRR